MQPKPTESSYGVWIVFAAIAMFLNFVGSAMTARDPEATFAFTRFLLGQLGLTAIWGVFGTGRWFLRWPATTILGEVLVLSFLIPQIFSGHGITEDYLLPTMLILPAMLLAAQLPLYAIKMLRGYHMDCDSAALEDSGLRGGQFGILDLLGGTTLVAVVFALMETARTVLPEYSRRSFWSPILFNCLTLVVLSAITVAPCLWATMRARRRGIAMLIAAVWTTLVPVTLIVGRNGGLSSFHPGKEVFLLILSWGILAATLLGGLVLIRSMGFVLLRHGEARPVAPADGDLHETDEEDEQGDEAAWGEQDGDGFDETADSEESPPDDRQQIPDR